MKHYCHGGPFLIIEFPYNFVVRTIRHFFNAHNISTDFTSSESLQNQRDPVEMMWRSRMGHEKLEDSMPYSDT